MLTAPLAKLGFYVHLFAWSFRCLLAAPSTSVKCVTEWAYNSVGQSPCLVAAYLEAICFSGGYTIPQLTNGSTYIGPVTDNGCQCNSVVYSLVSACADCQAQQFIKWSDWGKNCQTAYRNAFPYIIPPQTAIPGWAYLNMTDLDYFNISKAQSLAVLNTPESKGPGFIFGTSTSNGGSSTSVSISGSAPASSGSDTSFISTQHHQMAPAIWSIIGAVIGGVVVILLISSYFLARRWRQQRRIVRPATLTGFGTLDLDEETRPMARTNENLDRSPLRNASPLPAEQPRVPSRLSIPNSLVDLDEDEYYSPAIESSDLYTAHSWSNEHSRSAHQNLGGRNPFYRPTPQH